MPDWQCNHKFDGGKKCGTPHLDEDTVKQLFLKATNAIFAEKDGVREDYDSIKDTLFGTSELEAERQSLQDEMNVAAELIEHYVQYRLTLLFSSDIITSNVKF